MGSDVSTLSPVSGDDYPPLCIGKRQTPGTVRIQRVGCLQVGVLDDLSAIAYCGEPSQPALSVENVHCKDNAGERRVITLVNTCLGPTGHQVIALQRGE